MSNKRTIALCGAAVALASALAVLLVFRDREAMPQAPLREMSRAELDLRDGVLYATGEPDPFNGTLVESFPGGARRIALEIRSGRPHGISRGWYESGQLEVEEHFVEGVSHGVRTRWYANGRKKSEAQIVEGKIEGTFARWHENGRKAVEVAMVNGVAHGVSKAWDQSGNLKSRAVMKRGELVKRELFEDRNERHAAKTSS